MSDSAKTPHVVLADYLLEQATNRNRQLVGIAGPPGGGKSTLAEQLDKELKGREVPCCIVPMDGFHLDNRVLESNGTLHRKGAPNTFDADGFVGCIQRIKQATETVYVPVFDRDRDIAIAGAQTVSPTDDIVIVEGNYLLLDAAPWNALAPLFTIRLFINPGLDVVEQRILKRWRDANKPEVEVQAKTYGNDMPNAKTVIDESDLTHVVQFDPTRDLTLNLR